MTREERLKKWERRRRIRRLAFLKKAVLVFAAFIFLVGGLFVFRSVSKASTEESTVKKLYKTVTVSYGDTVWSIAEENLYGYDSVNEYVKEVTFINRLNNVDRICAGEVLVIPYYVDVK